MTSFGENLRKAREARDITLQEIAASTKIGTRALQALEDERFEQLPGGIFNKGFVRSYARCVGLDEEKTVAAYMEAANVAQPETNIQALSEQVTAAREMTMREPWLAIHAGTVVGALAVIVALGLGAMWLKEQQKEAREQTEAQHRVEQSAVRAAAPVVPPPVAAVPPAAATDAGTSAAVNPTAGAVPATAAAGVPTDGKSAQAATVGSSPVEVVVLATARSWVSVRSDGDAVETVTLDPDKPELRSRTYSAEKRVTLITGNPAGLSVTLNGKPAGTLGDAGRRATISFTPEGIQKQ